MIKIWQHYKGGYYYLVRHEAFREHDMEPVVVYQQFKTGKVFTRPKIEFFPSDKFVRFRPVVKMDLKLDKWSNESICWMCEGRKSIRKPNNYTMCTTCNGLGKITTYRLSDGFTPETKQILKKLKHIKGTQ